MLSLLNVLLSLACIFAAFTVQIPNLPHSFHVDPSGIASLTHYDLPSDYIASCGCVGLSGKYPTAAINTLIYGSSNSYGPACGTCYRLRLLSTPFSPPPPKGNGIVFNTTDMIAPSLVVKITDSCPQGGEWCSQTNSEQFNALNLSIHFDLAWPSRAIRNDFFPTDQGKDYGVWLSSYTLVDCREWTGFTDKQAWGSDWAQQSSACCPLHPSLDSDIPVSELMPDVDGSTSGASAVDSYDASANSQHCPSYSDQVASQLVIDVMSSQVPNTSNVLSRKERGQINGAQWSLTRQGLTWDWWFGGSVLQREPLEDWQAMGPALLPSLLQRRL